MNLDIVFLALFGTALLQCYRLLILGLRNGRSANPYVFIRSLAVGIGLAALMTLIAVRQA